VMDVWSRRILGVEMHERECSVLASAFFDRVCRDVITQQAPQRPA
jgi:putative transposase